MAARRKSVDEKLWARCVRSESGCLLFQGTIQSDGYGQIHHNGGPVQAHRLAWESVNGPIPDKAMILHRCDVRNCVEPSHLFVGDAQINMDDMMQKRRGRWRRGETHGNAKLTAEASEAIRTSLEPARILARKFGVSLCCIYHVKWGKTWKPEVSSHA